MLGQLAWEVRREQEIEERGELIGFACGVFPNSRVGVEGSRHYGADLRAHGFEITRAVRPLLRSEMPAATSALARALDEAMLRTAGSGPTEPSRRSEEEAQRHAARRREEAVR